MKTSAILEFFNKLDDIRYANWRGCRQDLLGDTNNGLWPPTPRSSCMGEENSPAAAVPGCIDRFIRCLLNTMDSPELSLIYHRQNHPSYDFAAESLGELLGWYTFFDGWLFQYGKERFHDPAESTRPAAWVKQAETAELYPDEHFVKTLIEHVRDMAVRTCDALLLPNAQGPVAGRWRNSDNLLAELIPDVLDIANMLFLKAISDGVLDLTYRSDDGEEIHLVQPDLVEQFLVWRANFAKSPFNPDCTLDNVFHGS